jgi:hypothetical protein
MIQAADRPVLLPLHKRCHHGWLPLKCAFEVQRVEPSPQQSLTTVPELAKHFSLLPSASAYSVKAQLSRADSSSSNKRAYKLCRSASGLNILRSATVALLSPRNEYCKAGKETKDLLLFNYVCNCLPVSQVSGWRTTTGVDLAKPQCYHLIWVAT